MITIIIVTVLLVVGWTFIILKALYGTDEDDLPMDDETEVHYLNKEIEE